MTLGVICNGEKSVIKEGHKSFPSGHTSCALTSYLSLKVHILAIEFVCLCWYAVLLHNNKKYCPLGGRKLLGFNVSLSTENVKVQVD